MDLIDTDRGAKIAKESGDIGADLSGCPTLGAHACCVLTSHVRQRSAAADRHNATTTAPRDVAMSTQRNKNPEIRSATAP